MRDLKTTPPRLNLISVVVPVYAGASTLDALVGELVELGETGSSPDGRRFAIREILLVDDNGRDGSAAVIRRLEGQHEMVRGVWLSRNYGQHAATLAGISQSTQEWVVTLDEDGQHDPRYLGALLDGAVTHRTQIAYGDPHAGRRRPGLRGMSSRGAKMLLAKVFGNPEAPKYQSFRLIEGEVARAVATSVGPGAFLDVALGWFARPSVSIPIVIRDDDGRPSTYSMRRLLRHFSWLLLTNGVQGLRIVSMLGVLSAGLGILAALWIVVFGLTTGWYPEGWASTYVTYLLGNGAVLLAIGIVAEYIGATTSRSLGRRAFHIVSDLERGPLGQP